MARADPQRGAKAPVALEVQIDSELDVRATAVVRGGGCVEPRARWPLEADLAFLEAVAPVGPGSARQIEPRLVSRVPALEAERAGAR
jgi:hypothetical protein